MKDDAVLVNRDPVDCDTAACHRAASVIVSREPLILLCAWCALARHERENGIRPRRPK